MTNGSAGTTIARKAKPPTRPTKASSMASEAVEQERFSPADTHKKKAKRAMAQASPSISEMKRLAPNPPGARRDVAAAVPATYAAKKRRTSNLQPAPVRGREDRKAVESPLQTLLATKTPMLPALLGLTQRETSPETSPVSESLNLVNPAWTFAAELPVPKSARGRWLRRLWNRLRLDGERGSLSAPTK